jgi:precorrin-8X/cobalt-precorrin-8 methylmutase
MEIIGEKLGSYRVDPLNINVVKRVIHTTADFEYAKTLVFSEGVLAHAKGALQSGARIVTDTQMAKAGINKRVLEGLGGSVHCFIDAPEVEAGARSTGMTRARAAVDWAAETLDPPVLFAVGNAPTALIRLHERVTGGVLAPSLIIGVPVGFVNVVEAKELILGLQVPHIVAKGQKGGSNVAAAICNALLYDVG